MLRTPFFLAVPLMLAGVAFAQKVQTDYDKSLDFSKFHTYAWREHPILRNNPQIGETFSVALNLVRSEINGDLTSKKLHPRSTLRIVAATEMLQITRFPQSSRHGVVEFRTCLAQTWRVRVNKCRRSVATNTTLRRADVF